MVKRPTSEDSTFFATYQEGGRKEGEKKRKKKGHMSSRTSGNVMNY